MFLSWKRLIQGYALVVALSLADSAWAILEKARNQVLTDRYSVIDSKLVADARGLTYRLAWIDSDRLIFSGQPVSEVLARVQKKDVRLRTLRIYVWNTRTNQAEEYAQLGPWGRFCYNEADGRIRYSIPGKPNVVKEGPLGKEVEVEVRPEEETTDARNRRGVFYHPLTCREHAFAPSDKGAQSWTFPLYQGHGILDVRGNQVDSRPIKLFSDDFKEIKEISLPRKAVIPGSIYFSKYKNAYVMFGNTAPPLFANRWGDWPEGVAQPIYLLALDGSVSVGAQIPWHDGFGQALLAFFTTKGLAYATSRPARDKGFFLLEPNSGKPIRLLSGSIVAGGVSPDGCKVAAAISIEYASLSGGVKVIDLCNGGRP